MSHSKEKPWFAPKEETKFTLKQTLQDVQKKIGKSNQVLNFFKMVFDLKIALFGMAFMSAAGFFFIKAIRNPDPAFPSWVFGLIGIVLLVISIYAFLYQLGFIISHLFSKGTTDTPMRLAIKSLFKEIYIDRSGERRPPAPELALQHFVQQVRAYANEQSYQRSKSKLDSDKATSSTFAAERTQDLTRRRWDDVADTLSQLEMYLSNQPDALIEKLMQQCPVQKIDVSRVFRETSEGFDTTWRKRGITIETAIVTPLKATTHEALLRKLLIGPWRASVLFALRSHTVLFAAKSENGEVIARWESGGFMMPEDYLPVALNTEIPFNERIEKGLISLSKDENISAPNILNGLISFLSFIDLAKACQANFSFKQTNEGFVTELRLK